MIKSKEGQVKKGFCELKVSWKFEYHHGDSNLIFVLNLTNFRLSFFCWLENLRNIKMVLHFISFFESESNYRIKVWESPDKLWILLILRKLLNNSEILWRLEKQFVGFDAYLTHNNFFPEPWRFENFIFSISTASVWSINLVLDRPLVLVLVRILFGKHWKFKT